MEAVYAALAAGIGSIFTVWMAYLTRKLKSESTRRGKHDNDIKSLRESVTKCEHDKTNLQDRIAALERQRETMGNELREVQAQALKMVEELRLEKDRNRPHGGRR